MAGMHRLIKYKTKNDFYIKLLQFNNRTMASSEHVDYTEWCRSLQVMIYENIENWKQKETILKIFNLMSVGDEFIGAETDPEVPKMALELFGVKNIDAKMTFGKFDEINNLKSLCFFHPNTTFQNAVMISLDLEKHKFYVTINQEMLDSNTVQTKSFKPHD
jgi:hypothetical protein